MATIVLTTVGSMVAGPIGSAIGAVIGQSIDAMIFAPKARQGPRLGDLAVQTSSYGTAIPKIFGTMRVAGTVIWSTDLMERRTTNGGGKGRPKTIDYSYSASFAVALSARRVLAVRRIWADGKLLRGAAGDFKSKTRFRLYDGDEDQRPDPLIAAAEGAGRAPAFRGTAYAMFEDMELAEFGNRIPSLSFELVADAGAVEIGALARELSGGGLAAGASAELLGYAASGDSVRGAIQDLVELGGLSLRDDGVVLRLERAGGEPLLLPRGGESGRRELVRGAAASVPGEVSLAYHDAQRDFQTGLQRATSGAPVSPTRAERRGLAASLSAGGAKAFAERRLDTLWTERVSAKVTCGWSVAGLRPGALVRLEGEGGSWRVRKATLGAMNVKLELVRSAEVRAAPGPASPGRPVSPPDLPHGPTLIRLLDLPLGSGEQPGLAVVATGAEPGWRRAELSVSFDQGASWADIGATPPPAAMGEAVTMLPPGDAALFDAVGSVEVDLLHAGSVLIGRDDDALVGGANLALIGEELVQFGRAERIGERRYRLSWLLRGRRGTEWAAAAHVAGEPFVLIEAGSLRTIELPAGMAAGGEVRLLASGVGDEAPAQASLIASGEALRPPSPVHLRAQATAGGGLIISWVRRSRQGWTWTSGSDTPLGEEREAYRVTMSGSGVSRAFDLSESSFVYSAAERAGDGAGPVRIEVMQMGTKAASRPAAIIIS